MDQDVTTTRQEVETIIDLDRAEILSILRDVQETSSRPEEPIDHFALRRLR